MTTHRYTAKLLASALLLLALASASVGEVFAQERNGTAGASHLLVPVTARHVSLGSSLTSGLANMNGLEALYANPAGLSVNGGTSAIFSRMDYVADIGVNYFGIGQQFGANNLALTINTWDFGDIALQTETSPEITDVTWTANVLTAGLTYARQLTDRISAGTTVKVISETIDDMSASAVAFDAGMTYVVGESGLRLGVSLKNIGGELQYGGTGLVRRVALPDQEPGSNANALVLESEGVELPSLLNFGVAYTRPVANGAAVTVLGNFRSNSFDQDQYSAGLELSFRDILYVRGGYEYIQDFDQSFFEAPRFGAGINVGMGDTALQFDYAFMPVEFFDGSVQFITASVTL